MDALDGLKALDAVVDALRYELKELHDDRNVPPVERVSLAPLQWAIDKLADDLHTIDTEVKDLRLAEAAARREVAELTKKVGELAAEPAPEPYQWKAGDQVVRDGLVREVQYVQHANGLLRICKEGLAQQCDHEQAGWKLHRKASDLGVQQLTPRQVEISDSTGTDGEGQT